jgi:signal recognition particle receptor subunit beta
MATLNFATRELTAKIVFFGAQGAGCNTNVARLFHLVTGHKRSALLKLTSEGETEHSWCFEFADHEAAPLSGFTMVFRVYSLPGAIGLGAHREEVVRGVDGVVFVADARADRNQRNVDALLELEGRLARSGLELAHSLVTLQVNHTDAEGARPMSDVVFDLNPYGFPVLEAVAHEGRGVAETFASVTERVREAVAHALSGGASPVLLTATHDPHRATDVDLLRAHEASIHTQLRTPPVQGERPSEPIEEAPIELVDGPTVEVPFQPRELAGFHPVRVLGTSVEGDRVWVELAMERMGGGEVRRVALVLQNRPPDTEPARALPVTSPVQTPPLDLTSEGSEVATVRSVFDYLPESVVYAEDGRTQVRDLPGVVYGLLGVGGGILIGLLSAYVLGAV